MATTLKVKCKNCNNTFNYYWHTFDTANDFACPHCCKKLDKQYVEQYIKPAFCAVWEANYKIRSKHEDGLCDWFEFNFEEIYVPNDNFKS